MTNRLCTLLVKKKVLLGKKFLWKFNEVNYDLEFILLNDSLVEILIHVYKILCNFELDYTQKTNFICKFKFLTKNVFK